ncbi:MAG: hypothetical protein ACLGSD_08585 [Acidobacteriota bacterium]
MDRNNVDHNRSNKAREQRAKACDPPGWMSTSELEDELFTAILEESSAASVNGDDGRFRAMDTYFAGDDYETEGERRRSLLRLLSRIRPQLADLLGGQPANEEI